MLNRKQLDEIINSDGGNNWWKSELFESKTLPLLPKELEILSVPHKDELNYNCFIYILGISDDKELIKDCNGFIYDKFIQKMIDISELIPTDYPEDGDYILYRHKDYPKMITHGGIIKKGGVVSKWAWGPIFKHDILDVPASYGDDISYIKQINKEKAKELYLKYKEFNKT